MKYRVDRQRILVCTNLCYFLIDVLSWLRLT